MTLNQAIKSLKSHHKEAVAECDRHGEKLTTIEDRYDRAESIAAALLDAITRLEKIKAGKEEDC